MVINYISRNTIKLNKTVNIISDRLIDLYKIINY